MEGLVQLDHKQRPSVIEQTIDAFNDLLLGHVQVHQANHSSILHTSQQGLIMPHKIIAMRTVLSQKIGQICLRREEDFLIRLNANDFNGRIDLNQQREAHILNKRDDALRPSPLYPLGLNLHLCLQVPQQLLLHILQLPSFHIISHYVLDTLNG